ncbi:MAG: response regulator [Filimonas sp.]|nr:response regulator [Filimonas sp.]
MILIVDDKQENIFSLKTLLEIHHFKVDFALSGEEALRKILKNTYALIILDVQMPDMDGFEVAEAISGFNKAKDIPIIFLSAVNTEKRFITKGYTSGGIDYVVKPFDPDILLLKVKTFYRLYEQTLELNNIQQELKAEIEYRKQAEQHLQYNVEELRSILESIPNIAFTAQSNGTIEYVNQHWHQYASMYTFPETMPGTESIATCFQKAIASQSQYVAEVMIKKQGAHDYRYHLLSMTPVKKADVVIKWVGIFTDIDEQKLAAETLEQKVYERTTALQEANKELEVANTELRQFAWITSHDLQEPLRKIQIFSHVVKDKYLQQDEKAQNYIDKVILSSSRMTQLIQDLLSYTKLSASQAFQVTDLNKTIKDVLSDFEILIQEKNATIAMDELPQVEMIPLQATQLFQNIISNALKYSRPDIPSKIEVKATRVATLSAGTPEAKTGKYIKISITDNGIGFNEIYLDKIFTIFQRLHPKDAYEGTGIGLAIVKKIVDKHNGIITASSRELEGATFTIVLPLRQS